MITSLGRGVAQDILAAILGGVALPTQYASASVALTVGTAEPNLSPVELTAAGYARQTVTWNGTFGLWSNNENLGWTLPAGTTLGGISIMNGQYSTLSNPLAWITLDAPINAVDGLDYVIPAHSIKIQGYTAL